MRKATLKFAGSSRLILRKVVVRALQMAEMARFSTYISGVVDELASSDGADMGFSLWA